MYNICRHKLLISSKYKLLTVKGYYQFLNIKIFNNHSLIWKYKDSHFFQGLSEGTICFIHKNWEKKLDLVIIQKAAIQKIHSKVHAMVCDRGSWGGYALHVYFVTLSVFNPSVFERNLYPDIIQKVQKIYWYFLLWS
jgi:hypothetical protein